MMMMMIMMMIQLDGYSNQYTIDPVFNSIISFEVSAS
jgi:hypothetical protein